MKRFLFSLAALFLLLLRLPAADWMNDKYHVSLVIPDSEGWMQQPLERSPTGESILTLSNERQRLTFWMFVTGVIPMDKDTVHHPAMPSRLIKFLQSRDFTPKGEPEFITLSDTEYIQAIGLRKGADGEGIVCLVRCAVFEKRMYFMVTTGPGDAERVAGGVFPRIVDSFRYKAPVYSGPTGPDPLLPHYTMAYRLCSVAAVGLLALFSATMYLTRWKRHE